MKMFRILSVLLISWGFISSVNADHWKYLNTDNSDLPTNAILDILFDDDGSIWFCTQDSGLIHYADGTYRLYNSTTADPFTADMVKAIVKDKNGVYWIATEYDGLFKMHNNTFTQYTSDSTGHNFSFLTDLAIQNGGPDEEGGAIWIGAWSNGLFRYDGNNWEYFDQASGILPDNSVNAVAVEHNPDPNSQESVVWVGTGSGLRKYDGTDWQNVSVGDQYDLWINDIALENGGTVYGNGKMIVGCENGQLCINDGNEWTIFNMADAWNPNNAIKKVALDSEGTKWFAMTDEGLGMYDGTQLLSYYTDNSGIAGNYVMELAVRESADSTEVWCSTMYNGYNGISIFTRAKTTGLEKTSLLPTNPELYQNYPNPFNPTTTISYRLSSRSTVQLSVYNALGKKVAILVNAIQNPGEYQVHFNASHLSSGVYFYRLTVGKKSLTRKMILLR